VERHDTREGTRMAVQHPHDPWGEAAGTWVIHVPAELNLETFGRLGPGLAEAMRSAVGTIVFDCGLLATLDADGIDALVGAADTAAGAGFAVRFVPPERSVGYVT
jgi:anti-anti-sigma regulatory factor